MEEKIISHIPDLKLNAFNFCKEQADREDLVQETVMRALLYKNGFKGDNLKGWLYKIMKNLYITSYNTNIKSGLVPMGDLYFNYPGKHPIISGSLSTSRDLTKVYSVIDKLDDKKKFAFTNYINGYKYKETAKMTGDLEATIKTRVRDAKRIIRKKLKLV